ncbi:MAG: hypothetical protein J3K34DRAFT_441330 [Monoraphidium minutum]|nr:MAG: hypothetical protein J3K34DRAFT_441330 [Monoraphidium minutum]
MLCSLCPTPHAQVPYPRPDHPASRCAPPLRIDERGTPSARRPPSCSGGSHTKPPCPAGPPCRMPHFAFLELSSLELPPYPAWHPPLLSPQRPGRAPRAHAPGGMRRRRGLGRGAAALSLQRTECPARKERTCNPFGAAPARAPLPIVPPAPPSRPLRRRYPHTGSGGRGGEGRAHAPGAGRPRAGGDLLRRNCAPRAAPPRRARQRRRLSAVRARPLIPCCCCRRALVTSHRAPSQVLSRAGASNTPPAPAPRAPPARQFFPPLAGSRRGAARGAIAPAGARLFPPSRSLSLSPPSRSAASAEAPSIPGRARAAPLAFGRPEPGPRQHHLIAGPPAPTARLCLCSRPCGPAPGPPASSVPHPLFLFSRPAGRRFVL